MIDFLEKHVTPIAEKVERNKYVGSIKEGMIALMAVLMVGSFSLVAVNLLNLFPEGTIFKEFAINNADFLNLPFTFTFGFLALYAAVTISIAHARKLDLPITHAIIASVLATLILCLKPLEGGGFDPSYLDSRGLFISIIAGISTTELMAFLIRKKVTIRIPGLPDMIGKTFEAIIPLLIICVAAGLVNVVSTSLTGSIPPEAITTITGPALNGIDSPLGVFVVILLEMTFWFVGLNGYAILIGIVLPFMTQYLALNAAAYAAGQPIPHIFTEGFWGYFIAATGSGVTGALVLHALKSKSPSLKASGKAALIPAIFGISEPVVYGLPIAYNPYLFIPFVFGTPILAVIIYEIVNVGLVGAPVAATGGMPIFLGQYLITMDWRAIPFTALIIFAAWLMYLPFFKAYEKQVLKEEHEALKKEGKLDKKDEIINELGLDF